jgi:ATP/maltotriose-dependent transcriptional regulator MalT
MIMSPLVGRSVALAALRGVLLAVSGGTGGCLIIQGPAGIGKSRLLVTAAAQARDLGVRVAEGRATPLDRVAPLTPLLTALRGCEPPVLDEAGLASLASHQSNRYWLVDRLGQLIEDYAATHPLLIVLDDAQWIDELTALALRALVPALRASPVLWLLARRPPAVRSAEQDAIDRLVEEGAHLLPLDPLSVEAVAELCANALGAVPDPELLSLAKRGGGNPFLLEELLTTLRDDGRVQVAGGIATVTAGDLPAHFRAAAAQRLREFSAEARRLLEAGSVFGRPFTLHEAAGLAGQPAVDMLGAAEEAMRAGILVDTGPELAFRHDLLREAVYNSLPGSARQVFHREAATVLQAEGRPAVEIAEHLTRSARKGDGQAVAVLHEAIRTVAPRAPSAAADFVLRMVGLLDDDDPSRARLIAERVRLLASAGRLREAREAGEIALRSGLDAPTEAALLIGLAEAFKHAGRESAVLEYARRALARPGVPEPARAQLLAIQAHGLLQADDIDGADESGRQALELGRATGEHSAAVFGGVARSVAARAVGELDTAIQLAHDAVVLAENAGGEARQRHPRLWLGRVLVAADRFQEADAVYEIGQREADELGTAWSQPLWHYFRGELRLAAGRLDDAAAEAQAGIRVSEQLTAHAMIVPLLALSAHVALRSDEVPAARTHLHRAQRMVADGIGVMPEDLCWEVALLAEAAGDPPATALAELAAVFDAVPRRLLLLTQQPSAAPGMVRMALRTGARNRAETVVAAARQLTDRNPLVRSFAGAATHAEGLLRDDLDALHTAVRSFQCGPRPLALASALEDAAVAEAHRGRRGPATALLEEALALCVSCGAKRDVARVQRRMRALGIRRPMVPGHRRPRNGWDSLTESELRVARLIAKGLTNRAVAGRLFLSPHTIDSHVRNAFTKLGVTSRVELTRQVIANDAGVE